MPLDVPTQYDTSSVIELRQYMLHPGKRDVLIDLFERRFVEGQEATGMRVLGQFRDASDPDRFVWLRGFRDMPTRAAALESFYGGPVWKANREAANATMVDSDNVLLLKPVDDTTGFALPSERGLASRVTALVVATVYLLQAPVDASFLRFFQERVRPVMAESGAEPIARFQSLEVPNNFPALPVREGEHAFVWFSSFEKTADYDRHLATLRESPRYGQMRAELDQRLKSPPQQLKLVPTFKSLIGPGPLTGDVHDFDFLEGDWDIHNWRLKQRGVGGNEWDEFPATSRGKLYLGGVANIDEIVFPTKGWSGLTVRTFDFATRQWSIYWVNSTSGELRSPVRGGFTGDHGEFFGEDDDGGKPIKVIFHWQRLGPGFARWSQEFSYDGGKTWETNWINELRRPQKPRG